MATSCMLLRTSTKEAMPSPLKVTICKLSNTAARRGRQLQAPAYSVQRGLC